MNRQIQHRLKNEDILQNPHNAAAYQQNSNDYSEQPTQTHDIPEKDGYNSDKDEDWQDDPLNEYRSVASEA